MGLSFPLGRIFGIPVDINASWLIVFILLTMVLANEFGQARLGWPIAQRWLVAVVMVICFFASVLAHELSHSVLAKREGIPVRGITLFIFGGVSRLGREPDRPLTEFVVAIAGPLTSIGLAAIFGGLWYLLNSGNDILGVMLFLLAWSNLTLGVFNILPGYPLDGGRVLRAVVWGLTGSYRKGTQVSTRAGQAIGGLTLLTGLVLGILVSPVDGVWLALVGGFLFSIATADYRRERDRAQMAWLEHLPSGRNS
jgi:Zn-dependent protease